MPTTEDVVKQFLAEDPNQLTLQNVQDWLVHFDTVCWVETRPAFESIFRSPEPVPVRAPVADLITRLRGQMLTR